MRKTWKKALSGVLSATLAVSLLAIPEGEKTTANAAEDAFINVYSEDYSSTSENSKWTSVWTDSSDVSDKIEANEWRTWSPSAQKAEFTATFSELSAGDYRLSLVAVGGDMGASTVTLGTVSKDLLINAWNDSGAYSPTVTDTVAVAEGESLTVTLKLDFQEKGWCNFDDILLQKKGSADEAVSAEKEKLTKLVSECKEYSAKESWYTEKSWKAFSEALQAAETLLAKADASAADLTAAYKALKRAENKLMEKSIYVNKVDGLSQDFMRGVDISSYVSIVESGAVFKDNDGKVLDDQGFFDLLKASGVNWVRVRVWNDPYDADGNGYGGGNSDLEKAIKIGKWATKAGLRVLIDFHYSDYWADPGRQLEPKAWKGFTVAQKEEALYNFTKESLQKLLDEGVDVGMVQVGNETNNGIAGVDNWEDMGKLFAAGSKAVREVSKDILVALHFTNPEVVGKLMEFAEKLKTYNVDYDVFASSFYPAIHGTMENITKVLSDVATTYNKKVMVAETSWGWTNDDGDGNAVTFDTGSCKDYAVSVQGQATEVRDVVDAVNKVENGAGIGVFYWEPAWIPVQYAYDEDGKLIDSIYKSNEEKWEKYGSGVGSTYAIPYMNEEWSGGSVKDHEAFFDFEGNPLASLTVFKDIYEGTKAPVIRLETIKDGSVEILLESSDVTAELAKIQAALPGTVTGIYNDSSTKELRVVWNKDELNSINAFGNYEISGTAAYQDEFGKDVEKTVSCAVSVFPDTILKNGDFEGPEGEGWTLENAETSINNWNETPVRGDGSMHFYNADAVNFTAKQTVKVEKAGYYCASMYVQGEENPANIISLSVTNLTTKAAASIDLPLKGWAVWQTDTTDSVAAEAGEELQVVITVKGAAGAWGSIDDVFLYKTDKAPSVSPSPSPSPSPAPSQTPAKTTNACKKLTGPTTSTIKKTGKTVTLVYKITAANKKKKTTDKVTVTIKNKKIAKVTKKPLTIGKLTITVKGLKKGKTTLTVKVGKKSVKTTIQVKK